MKWIATAVLTRSGSSTTGSMEGKDMDKEFLKHLEESIDSFKNDPADTDFQRGYLAALKECKRVMKMMEAEHHAH